VPSLYVTFEIYGLDGKATIELTQGPDTLTERAKRVSLGASVGGLSSWPPPMVQSYGQELLRRLNNAPDATVREAIKHVVTTNGTIYFKLKAPEWESHAWEALCDQNDFILLQPDRGMGRKVEPTGPYSDPVLVGLEQPVRIMSVLSAAGLSGAAQWKALYKAARANAANAQGVALQLHVLTGEEALTDQIRADLPQDPKLSVTVTNLDGEDAEGVVNQIRSVRPHVLHFFCHGQVVNGAGVLRLSSVEQHRQSLENSAEAKQLAFTMGYDRFRKIIQQARAGGWLWLIVLNACKLGVSGENVSALTQKFAVAGVPAAIGMTEEIDVSDATDFTAAFYPSLFLELSEANSALKAGNERELDWAKLLYAPRVRISGKRSPASCNPQWTFPVLYVSAYTFKLSKPVHLADQIRDDLNRRLAGSAVAGEIAKVKS
jgi:CHAT domain